MQPRPATEDNLLIQGDNLEALKALVPCYRGLFSGGTTESYRQLGTAGPVPLGQRWGQMLMSVALGNSEVRVKPMCGTSVHDAMKQMSLSGG